MINPVYSASPERYTCGMKYRRCGKSGILLPEISLGLWQNFGDTAPLSRSREILLHAFDNGICHFDLASLDQSLRRMNLDYVDIFYSHRFDPETPLEETMQALVDIVRSGKALYAGISNYPAEAAAFAYSYLRGHDVPCLLHQVKYNMMHRIPESEGLIHLADKAGSGLIAFSPLAQGLLTDRYLEGVPAGSRAERNFSLKKDILTPELTGRLIKLNKMAARRGQTLAQMALAWVLKDSRVTSVIVGASSMEQLDANLKAIGNTVFCDEELAQINALTL